MNNPFERYDDPEYRRELSKITNPFDACEDREFLPVNPFEREPSMDTCRECDQEFPSTGSQFCSVQCRETFEQMTGLTVEEYDAIEEESVSA